jgi:superfamily II DNA or RNA helicase
LSKTNIEDKNNDMYKLLNLKHNKLFMSATPITNIKFDKIYKYSWKDAIDNKYICDFKIIIPVVEDKLENFNKFIGEINKDINIKIFCKTYFIIKSLLYNANKKCIIFLTTIEKAKDFENCLEIIGKILNVKLDMWQLNCHTCKTKRDDI